MAAPCGGALSRRHFQPLLQVRLQGQGAIVFRVVSTVEEGNVAVLGCVKQRLESCRIAAKLGPIPSLEFLPFDWIVAKPASQVAARR